MAQAGHRYPPSTNWRQVVIFLGLTFGLTYLLDLALYLTIGYGQSLAAGLTLQVRMLIPAWVAIALEFLVFRNSSIYHFQGRPRWFFIFYLVYGLLYAATAFSALLAPDEIVQTIASVVAQILNLGGLLFLIILRLVSGQEAFRQAGLTGGRAWHWAVFGLFLVMLYAMMTGLNALFDLGQAVDAREFLDQASSGQATGLGELSTTALLLIVGFQTIIVGPLIALLIAFGEEYGWRSYLQGELVKLGKARGILLVGIIWGLWHVPVVLMGHNYPGYPVLGVLLMTLYTIALAFLFGYAMLRSGSVWLVAFLHGLNNQVLSFLILLVYAPDDPAFSFGIGLYGLVIWALVVAAILVLAQKEWATPVQPGKASGSASA